jgi:hypothetical protein
VQKAIINTSFTEWATEAEPKIRQSLTAAFGVQVGKDAAADALALAWERWDRVSEPDQLRLRHRAQHGTSNEDPPSTGLAQLLFERRRHQVNLDHLSARAWTVGIQSEASRICQSSGTPLRV